MPDPDPPQDDLEKLLAPPEVKPARASAVVIRNRIEGRARPDRRPTGKPWCDPALRRLAGWS